MGKCLKDCKNEDFVDSIAHKFNNTLKFDPRQLKMAYTVRDPVPHGIHFCVVTYIAKSSFTFDIYM